MLRLPNICARWLSALVLTICCLSTAAAQADITRPGDHVHYLLDLEPHFALQWAGTRAYDQGFGFGVRTSFVVVDNGPIPKVNNTLAIGTGGDFTFFDNSCGPYDCNGLQFWVPVVAQWNFYFSSAFVLFPEIGIAFRYYNSDANDLCSGLVVNSTNSYCGGDDFGVQPAMWLGGRYIVNDTLAVTFRMGYPSMNIGASIFL